VSDIHPLAGLLDAAASGSFPPVDGVVEVLGPDPSGTEAIVEFTGHAYVLTTRPQSDALFVGVDAFGGTGAPAFVTALAAGAAIGSHDAVLVRRGGGAGPRLTPTTRFDGHPRVTRARHHRCDVVVLGDERGLVTIGSGLVGRTEISVEVTATTPTTGGAGSGRALIRGALATRSVDEWVYAQVSPGNAASLRAFLASGFRPIGSEILIDRN